MLKDSLKVVSLIRDILLSLQHHLCHFAGCESSRYTVNGALLSSTPHRWKAIQKLTWAVRLANRAHEIQKQGAYPLPVF
jgi:hypothetical protein